MDQQQLNLAQVIERKAKRSRLARELAAVRAEIEAQTEQVELLEQAVSKETADVERLESMSLQNLIQTVLGKKGERLEKEQLEALTARINHQTAVHLLEIMRSEEADLQTRLEPQTADDIALEKLLNPEPADAE